MNVSHSSFILSSLIGVSFWMKSSSKELKYSELGYPIVFCVNPFSDIMVH